MSHKRMKSCMIGRMFEEIVGIEASVLKFSCSVFSGPVAKHSHGEGTYELHYIPHGRGLLKADGRELPLYGGCCFLTGPHVEHEQIPDEAEPMEELCLNFSFSSKSRSSMAEAFRSNPFFFSPESGDIAPILRLMQLECGRTDCPSSAAVDACLVLVLVTLLRMMTEKVGRADALPPIPAGRSAIRIEEILLNEHADITLGRLAKRLDLSCRQTERLLHRLYGKTFTSLRLEARMEKGKMLLQSGEYSVEKIASILGYSSAEHFSVAFSRRFGMSPSKFAKSGIPEL